MGIRLITKRQDRKDTTISKQTIEEIREAMEQGTPSYLIVPDHFTLRAEQELVLALGIKGLMNVEVLSFDRLKVRVLQEVGGARRFVIDDHGRQMLLIKAIQMEQANLKTYGKSSKKLGFFASMTEFIGELKQNNISVDKIQDVLGEGDEGLVSQKLLDIHRIYKTYELLIGEDRWDLDDQDKMLCEKILHSQQLQGAKIWVQGFFTFSSNIFAILGALAQVSQTLTITVIGDMDPMVSDAGVFDVCRNTLDILQNIANENGVGFKHHPLFLEKNREEALDHLEQELFSYTPKPYHGTPNTLDLRQFQNPWEEATETAFLITQLVRDQGYQYKDIGILVGQPQTQGQLILRALKQYQIPCHMDEVMTLTDHHLVEAVLSALETIALGFDKEALFAYAKSGFAPISQEESTDLENYVIALGIDHGEWRSTFAKNNEKMEWDLESLENTRQKLITPLIQLEKEVKGKTYGQALAGIFEFLVATKVPETIDWYVLTLGEQEQYDLQSPYNQIWNILMTVFEQIYSAMGEEKVKLSDLIEVLKGGFSTYSIGILAGEGDVVHLRDPYKSRGNAPKVLLVLGLNEGLLPKESVNFNFFTDAERQGLKSKGLILQDTGRFRRVQAEYSLYQSLCQVHDKIYFSYCICDEEGETLSPSTLIDQIRNAFPNLERNKENKVGELDWIVGGQGTLNNLALKSKKAQKNDVEVIKQVENWYKEKDHKDFTTYQKALTYGGVEAQLPKEIASLIFPSPIKVSVSQIEKYRGCPFAHFVNYGIKPRLREEFAVKGFDLGSMLHEVVDSVFKQAQQDKIDLKTLETKAREDLVDKALSKKMSESIGRIFESTGQYRYLGKKLKRVSQKTVEVITKHLTQGKFDFQRSEEKFNQEIIHPNLPKGVGIRGVIDRIDTFVLEGDTYVKIIDYKSSEKAIDWTMVYYGLSIQLLVYMDAGMEIIDKEALTEVALPAGAFYFHMDDPMLKEKVLDIEKLQENVDKKFQMKGLFLDDDRIINALDTTQKSTAIIQKQSKSTKLTKEEIDNLLIYVKSLIGETALEMTQGKIEIAPYKIDDKSACDYCDYGAICQFDTRLSHNAYRVLNQKMNKQKIMEKIGGEENGMDQ